MLIRRIATHVLAPAALVLFTSAAAQAQFVADLDITKVAAPNPVVAGNNLTYTITVSNAGPDPAVSASLSDTLPAATTFVSLASPGGWSCTTPAVGAGGTISCSLASMNVGSAVFTLMVAVDVSASGTVSNTATITSSTSDPTPANNSATANTTVNAPTIVIHDIQGNGASSPIVGASVTIRGIVTGVTATGFFVQEEDVDFDADPLTSEGIFVFTSSAPPVAAAFSAQVQVTGTVSEFVPAADPQDPPSTRAHSADRGADSAGHAAASDGGSTLAHVPEFQRPSMELERVEHMRVSVASLTVSGPSGGSLDEINATGSNDGRFYGVVTGVARPFREAGIQAPDTAPSGTIPPIPRWDFNPERFRIDSAGLVGQSPLLVSLGRRGHGPRRSDDLPVSRLRAAAGWDEHARHHTGHADDDGHRCGRQRVHRRLDQPATLLRHRRRSRRRCGDEPCGLRHAARENLDRDPRSPAQPGHHRACRRSRSSRS